MTPDEINAICDRHRIPKGYQVHYRRLVLDYLILSKKFGRLIRRNAKFRTCLEDIKSALSAPYMEFFEIPVVSP
jgi:hypothetical protein